MEIFRRTFAEINLENLGHNFKLIQQLAGADRFLCPMVKANAYGHGDVQVAQYLAEQGASHLGVCLIEEGLLIRQHHVKADILVFRGFDKVGAEKIVEAQLTPVVSTWEQISALEAVADETVKVHLKFNTGMNRLGFDVSEAEKLRAHFKTSKKLKLKALLSHFYAGEDAFLQEGHSSQQAKLLQEVYQYFKSDGVYMHLLNSGGICSFAKPEVQQTKNHFLNQNNWGFRPGLMLYGYAPNEQHQHLDLKPVMTFKSVVNNIRIVKKNGTVSYGGHWKAERDSLIAVVPVGYADGVHRLISTQGFALFAGKKVPIVGRVCMDFLMLDVTDAIRFEEINKYNEEEVVIFGFDSSGHFISAEETAHAMKTIAWEVLTSVGERVPRHFKGAST